MAKCNLCGEKLNGFTEILGGTHKDCMSKFQKERQEGFNLKYKNEGQGGLGLQDASDIESDEDNWNYSKPNSSTSTNSVISDTAITLVNVIFFFALIGIVYISSQLPLYKFEFFLLALTALFLNFGIFSIFAEMYRNLKEINSKIKHPDND